MKVTYDPEGQVIPAEDFPRYLRLGALVAAGANGIDEDIGVNEGHCGRAGRLDRGYRQR